jgi:hypothetical protein
VRVETICLRCGRGFHLDVTEADVGLQVDLTAEPTIPEVDALEAQEDLP